MAEIMNKETLLNEEVSVVESRAAAMMILSDDDFQNASALTKDVKAVQKRVDAYWEPMRESAYTTYKNITDHKKAMLDPLKKAETILKKKMSDYLIEKEKRRKAEEERLRELARKEVEKKLEEAADAEAQGDMASSEYALVEAEVMDDMVATVSVGKTATKADGIIQKKAWKITGIDLSQLPTEFGGVLIRPADESAIMGLIKASKGAISIPGVMFEETVQISVKSA